LEEEGEKGGAKCDFLRFSERRWMPSALAINEPTVEFDFLDNHNDIKVW
jgi:hypothetical protein